MVDRRKFLMAGSAVLAGAAIHRSATAGSRVPGRPNVDYTPVVTPNGSTLPWKVAGEAKVYHLVAEPVRHEMAPGLDLECWGYNGSTPGPTIEAVEGDLVRIYVTNHLEEPTSIHWHGMILPNGMDGIGGLTQPYIMPGETFRYEFPLLHPGTFMYHPHVDEMTQMALGMMGMFVIHPRRRSEPRIDRDFVLLSSEWMVRPGWSRPDPNAMDFNMLTFNSKAFPGTDPLVVERGDRVRIRFGNLSGMDHHPIHLHGHVFRIVETNGGPIPREGQWPETTVLVYAGTTRAIEFVADAPGDWPMHCHMNHHVMNQMGHDITNMTGLDAKEVDGELRAFLPEYASMGVNGMAGHGEHMAHMRAPRNSIAMKGGPGKFGYIDMGGMFTILKVRERLEGDPGWYDHPKGTVARTATAEELAADGVSITRRS